MYFDSSIPRLMKENPWPNRQTTNWFSSPSRPKDILPWRAPFPFPRLEGKRIDNNRGVLLLTVATLDLHKVELFYRLGFETLEGNFESGGV